MLAWLGNNIGTILVVLVLAGVVALIVWNLRKEKKAGRHACCGDCGHCSACKTCQK